MSVITMSGRWASALRTRSVASPAAPTTSRSASASTWTRPSRMIGSSSPITTRRLTTPQRSASAPNRHGRIHLVRRETRGSTWGFPHHDCAACAMGFAARRSRLESMDAKLDSPAARSHRGGSRDSHAERALVLAAKADRAERDRLVETFLPLIAAVARLYRNTPGVDREELMQEGVVGLLRALERYDPSFGTPFWAYASSWVRQAMQQLVAELSGPIVLSDRALRKLARVRECRRERAQAIRREPTITELAEQTELSQGQIEHLLAAQRTTRAIDEPLRTEDGDSCTLNDLLVD